MCLTHGLYEFRCEQCCLDEQIDHAKSLTARLPQLIARRRELDPSSRPERRYPVLSAEEAAAQGEQGTPWSEIEERMIDALKEPDE